MALTNDEKRSLARRIAKGVEVISSSIAQLHLGSPDPNLRPDQDETGIVRSLLNHGPSWKFTNIEGALLLTKDPSGILHFRIYDLQQYKLRFQYELYNNINYQKVNSQLHCFEMENCMCGFSFSSVAVAEKFHKRVTNNSPKQVLRNNPPLPTIHSPGYNTRKPMNSRMGSNNNLSSSKKGKGRSRKTNQQVNMDNMFLGNGMLDPQNVPPEWKKILKKAGIKKKHLQDPQMFQIIKETLAAHNIALDPPTTTNYEDERLKDYYSDQQIREWKEYQVKLKKYEEDQKRYERELAEYNRQKEQEEKQRRLQNMISHTQPQSKGRGIQNLRQSVQKFSGQDVRDLQSLIPQVKQKQQPMAQMPRASVARPLMPALPVIPETHEEKVARMINQRVSRVVISPNMLNDLHVGVDLKRLSVMPSLQNKSAGEQNGILATLREKLAKQRVDISNDNADGDSGSEWEEEE